MSVFETSVQVFLAPVLPFLKDDSVTEVMINGPSTVFIERAGFVEKTDVKFEDANSLMAAIRNIAQFVGRPIDEERPFLDARLPDGSRIHAVIPPIAQNGATVAIRKFSKTKLQLKDLIEKGALPPMPLDSSTFAFISRRTSSFLAVPVPERRRYWVLSRVVPAEQRILVLEDSAELKIHNQHVVFMEARPADEFGKGLVTLRDLVKSSLRMRPDRVIVGEVRGGEALDLISSMNTGHSGSMGTVHANNPRECLTRLETLALMTDSEVPVQAVRAQVAAAINIVIQLSRIADGSARSRTFQKV